MIHGIQIKPITCEQAIEEIRVHANGLCSPFDSYYEAHLLKSEYFQLFIDGEAAGLTGVFEKQLLTYFAVEPAFRRESQRLFQEAKRLQEVTSAYVYTADELYLAHVLETAKTVNQQAYFFKCEGLNPEPPQPDEDFEIRLAAPSDFELALAHTGDFFDELENQINRGDIFVGTMKGQIVAYGIIEKSKLINQTASIGMIVLETERLKGYGTKTLRALKRHCESQSLRVIAGCWYYNHQSKKTLEAAGLYSQTRLLKIGF